MTPPLWVAASCARPVGPACWAGRTPSNTRSSPQRYAATAVTTPPLLSPWTMMGPTCGAHGKAFDIRAPVDTSHLGRRVPASAILAPPMTEQLAIRPPTCWICIPANTPAPPDLSAPLLALQRQQYVSCRRCSPRPRLREALTPANLQVRRRGRAHRLRL